MRGARHLGMPWMQARNVGERAHWKLVVTFVIKHDKWREPPRMENMNAGFVSGMDTPAHFTVVYLAAPGYSACGCVRRTQPALIPADLVGKLEEIVDEECVGVDRPWCGNKPGRLPIMNAERVEGTVIRKSAGKIGETGPIYTLRYRVDQMLQAYDHGRGWFWSSTDGAGGEAMKHVHCSAGVNVADAEVNFHNVTFGTSLAPIRENLPLHWRILSGGFGGCLREFKIASLIAEAEEPITSGADAKERIRGIGDT